MPEKGGEVGPRLELLLLPAPPRGTTGAAAAAIVYSPSGLYG